MRNSNESISTSIESVLTEYVLFDEIVTLSCAQLTPKTLPNGGTEQAHAAERAQLVMSVLP